MSDISDPRARVVELLTAISKIAKLTAETSGLTAVDQANARVNQVTLATVASPAALLYIGDQFAALVEQHRISNVIAAAQAIASTDGAMPHRAYTFLRSVINNAVTTPATGEEPQR